MSATTAETLSPGWLDSLFTRSITEAVAAVGDSSGVPALEWRVRIDNGEIVVLGTPPEHSSEPVALCREWARALGLDRGRYDASEDVSSWSRVDGPWLIEVSTSIY
ncbi:hypothetical protein GCM10027413_32280 [Conyzicola nivalis]|uniref:Uncharacterized protein n=1 Tax=Conyzicola nivalis TaxID=1477021 RepID=A0A916WM73_9MICO|nr:hypothetical protein [Conyzicola nivalis]GGB11451.1 hypothetical protein GCM10010979_27210 [Conyzicola nivalis]